MIVLAICARRCAFRNGKTKPQANPPQKNANTEGAPLELLAPLHKHREVFGFVEPEGIDDVEHARVRWNNGDG